MSTKTSVNIADALKEVWSAPLLKEQLFRVSPLHGLLPIAWQARSLAHARLLAMGRWLDDIDADVVVHRPFDWMLDT